MRWSEKIYSGPLNEYTYPRDIECGELLQFLKSIDGNKRVHLTDVMFRNNYPPTGYDVYIICSFGEFVDEEYIRRLDNDENISNPIVLTSQIYTSTDYKRVKIFHLEHLHTIKRFFNKESYSALKDRTKSHGVLSRRNALHKTIITAKLLNKFNDKLNYTFCNNQIVTDHSGQTVGGSKEYKPNVFKQELDVFYPSIKLNDADYAVIEFLHKNPVAVPGNQWGTDNVVYQDSKIIWATESIFLSRANSPLAYLTEKIIKPIISGSAFVLVSQQHSQLRLDNLGFKSPLELSSDAESDTERFNELFDLIDNYDFDALVNSKETQEIVDYNYNYFWGAFYSHIEYRNQERIEAILDYINET